MDAFVNTLKCGETKAIKGGSTVLSSDRSNDQTRKLIEDFSNKIYRYKDRIVVALGKSIDELKELKLEKSGIIKICDDFKSDITNEIIGEIDSQLRKYTNYNEGVRRNAVHDLIENNAVVLSQKIFDRVKKFLNDILNNKYYEGDNIDSINKALEPVLRNIGVTLIEQESFSTRFKFVCPISEAARFSEKAFVISASLYKMKGESDRSGILHELIESLKKYCNDYKTAVLKEDNRIMTDVPYMVDAKTQQGFLLQYYAQYNMSITQAIEDAISEVEDVVSGKVSHSFDDKNFKSWYIGFLDNLCGKLIMFTKNFLNLIQDMHNYEGRFIDHILTFLGKTLKVKPRSGYGSDTKLVFILNMKTEYDIKEHKFNINERNWEKHRLKANVDPEKLVKAVEALQKAAGEK